MSDREHLMAESRRGFTLVELMVSISIIGIMSSMVLYALLGAQTDAKIARTRGTVQKINEIILQKWEEFRYKPIQLELPSGVVHAREVARLRMTVLRDVMRMEMPDRITDLIYPPTQYTVEYPTGAGFASTKISRAIPGGYGILYGMLRSQIAASKKWSSYNLAVLPAASFTATFPVAPLSTNTDAEWDAAVQSSELLYLLVSTCNFGGSSALEHFRSSEVGDTDDDGLLEFIDGWGNAISWIRWPAGYPGDLVRYADNDAMDPVKTDWRYRNTLPDNIEWHPRTLVPLVISAGPDRAFGVRFDFPNPSDRSRNLPIAYATMTWPDTPAGIRGIDGPPPTSHTHYAVGPYYYPDPFFTWDERNSRPNGPLSTIPAPASDPRGYRHNQIGSVPNFLDDGVTPNTFAADNITNHDLILEP